MEFLNLRLEKTAYIRLLNGIEGLLPEDLSDVAASSM